MLTLSERLEIKGKEVLKRFIEDHPIWAAIRQPLTAETKRIMHRIFRVYVEVGPQWYTFAAKALECVHTPEEKEVLGYLLEHFSEESIENLLAQQCRPFFGEISAEVWAEKSSDVLPQIKTLMERVLTTNDGLHCLVMFYAPTQIGNILWQKVNLALSQQMPGFLMEGIDDELQDFREAIDNHPKAQNIDDRTFEDYANTYLHFLELDVKGYDYFYDLS